MRFRGRWPTWHHVFWIMCCFQTTETWIRVVWFRLNHAPILQTHPTRFFHDFACVIFSQCSMTTDGWRVSRKQQRDLQGTICCFAHVLFFCTCVSSPVVFDSCGGDCCCVRCRARCFCQCRHYFHVHSHLSFTIVPNIGVVLIQWIWQQILLINVCAFVFDFSPVPTSFEINLLLAT